MGPQQFLSTQIEYSLIKFSISYLKWKVDNLFETSEKGNMDNYIETEGVAFIELLTQNGSTLEQKVQFNQNGQNYH